MQTNREVLIWTFEVPDTDPEIQVMAVALALFNRLGSDTRSRQRVLCWLVDRLEAGEIKF